MGIFDSDQLCPPHNWTKWETRTERYGAFKGWGKNKQLFHYNQQLQSRECTVCGYREDEQINP
jgi:hypothetical protein